MIEALKIADDYKKGVLRISFGYGMEDQQIQDFKYHFKEIMKQLKGE